MNPKAAILILFWAITSPITLLSQDIKLFNKISSAICSGSIDKALKKVNSGIADHANKDYLITLNLIKSRLLLLKEDTLGAITTLNGITAAENKFEYLPAIKSPCDWEYQYFNWDPVVGMPNVHHDLCDLYLAINLPDKALANLNKINNKKIPSYSGCANYMIKMDSYLALKYSKCYLQLKDTTSAIQALTGYFLFQEGPTSEEIFSTLKQLLHKVYTKEEIAAEIDSSLKNMKDILYISSSGFESESVELIIYGRKIPFLYQSAKELLDDKIKINRLNSLKE